jgi:hypothetical protein
VWIEKGGHLGREGLEQKQKVSSLRFVILLNTLLLVLPMVKESVIVKVDVEQYN